MHHDDVVEDAHEGLRGQPRALRGIRELAAVEDVEVVVAEHGFGAQLHQQCDDTW